MKVAGIVPGALAALLLSAAPAPTTATAAGHGRPLARPRAVAQRPATPFEARLLACRRSPKTDARTAVVGASMRPIAGAKRLALRVELYQRPIGGGAWTLRADVPGLGEWTSPSDPSIGTRPNDVYKYRQAVGRLVVPYAYRFRVDFRWSDAAGRVVREETASTRPCREPDLRPDVTITAIDVGETTDEATSRYTVTVRNVGRSSASQVGVAATFAARTRTVRRLLPGESSEVTFLGPVCVAGEPGPTFFADPTNAIDEARETNNSLFATCPATLDRP